MGISFRGAHQIPSLFFDIAELIFRNDSPNAIRDTCTILESKVQFNFICSLVVEFHETPDNLVRVLE